VEGWEQRLLDNVANRNRDRSRPSRGHGTVLNLSPELHVALDAACALVDLNRSAYIRNSLAASVSRHLDVDPVAIMATTPRSTGWERYAWTAGAVDRWPRDTGSYLPLFCAHPNCDGSHLINRS
jgi:hypothetical protein